MVPIPMPSTKLVMISCALFRLSGLSAAPICGKAGSIASIEKRDRRHHHSHQRDEFGLAQPLGRAIMICRRFGR